MNRLENWSVVSKSPYHPPECGQFLAGEVYGHHKRPDGQRIRTSAIARVNGDIVTTESGSLYVLGEPDPEYIEYCKKNNFRIPTKEEPLRMKDE